MTSQLVQGMMKTGHLAAGAGPTTHRREEAGGPLERSEGLAGVQKDDGPTGRRASTPSTVPAAPSAGSSPAAHLLLGLYLNY